MKLTALVATVLAFMLGAGTVSAASGISPSQESLSAAATANGNSSQSRDSMMGWGDRDKDKKKRKDRERSAEDDVYHEQQLPRQRQRDDSALPGQSSGPAGRAQPGERQQRQEPAGRSPSLPD